MARSCSVCDDDLSTDHLCRACRDDPANQGWGNPSRREVHYVIDAAPTPFPEATPPRPPARAREIIELLRTTVTVEQRAQGRARYQGNGTVVVERAPRLAEIARWIGCSRQHVHRTLRWIEEHLAPQGRNANVTCEDA